MAEKYRFWILQWFNRLRTVSRFKKARGTLISVMSEAVGRAERTVRPMPLNPDVAG
jgi:hypothetical protein